MHLSHLQLLEFAAVILISGAASGLIAGLFGVGGGIVTVPVLFTIFKLMGTPPDSAIHLAIGTSLATIIPTSIASLRAHNRRKAVDKTIVKQWALAIVIGAALGGIAATYLSGTALSLTFGIFTVFIATLMGLAPPHFRIARHPPGNLVRLPLAALIGFISALVGVGGGSLSVPAMVLYNVPIHRAIGTAAAIGLLISLPATIVFMAQHAPGVGAPPGSFGLVNLLAFALLAPVTMLTAPQGARLAHGLPAVKLRRIFSIFLFLIAAKMIFGAVG